MSFPGPSLRAAATALCLLFALGSPVAGQTLTTGEVYGVVRDAAGQPLNGALVSLTDAATGVTRAATTSWTGAYRFSFLPPGEYEVFAEHLGYRPKRVTAVPSRPSRRVQVDVALAPAPPPVGEAEVERFVRTGAEGDRAGLSQWFSRFALEDLPGGRRDIGRIGRLSSVAGPDLEVEGLPGSLTTVAVDGLPFAPARHPAFTASPLRAAPLPLGGLEAAELVTNGLDVEWAEFAGGALSLLTRRGTSELEARGFGIWSGAGLASADAGSPGYADLQGGAFLSGPIVPDSAHVIVGVEARRIETPLSRAWAADSLSAALRSVALDSFGVDLDGYTEPLLARTEGVSAFGRLDWQLASRHAIDVRAAYAAIPRLEANLDPAVLERAAGVADGRDAIVGAALRSELTDRFANELRLGFETSRRDYEPTDAIAAGLPRTTIVGGGLVFGHDPALPGRFQATTVRLGDALHLRGAEHHVKLGFAATLSSHEYEYRRDGLGSFFFGGVDQLARGEGVFARSVGPVTPVSFVLPQVAVFLQDQWLVQPGLELLLGLRLERERLPDGKVVPNHEWQRLTGLSNATLDGSPLRLAPRLGMRWDIHPEWRLRAGAGFYYDRVDPGLIGEVLTLDGRTEVRRGLGRFSGWPGSPDLTDAVSAPTLTLLAPDFQAPRTARVSGGITRILSGGMAAHLSGVYRRTDFLPRRTDLNLVPAPRAHDQHGRPVFGDLVQQGALLAAVPGSSRRFPDFDVVSAVSADGSSDYFGVTLAFERNTAGPLDLTAGYTYSRTNDDWPLQLAGTDRWLAPELGDAAVDWLAGRSDLDAPHRLVLGAEFEGPRGLRFAGLYRFRSGFPFSPGFRDGVDANGDGSARNDPAFVDPDTPGMADLIARWDCLREQVGRFAERNSCRTGGVHALDLRLAMRVFDIGGAPAEVFLDGLDLIDSDAGVPDAALVLVDPDGQLVADREAGTVALPLIANPQFGEPLARRVGGRVFRLGFSVNW